MSSKAKKSGLVTVEELAKASKASIATIDHYVDIGLLNVASRQGTTRLFDRQLSLERLKEIHELLGRGLFLKEIKKRLLKGNNQARNLFTGIQQKINVPKIKKLFERRAMRNLAFICAGIAIFYLGRATGGR